MQRSTRTTLLVVIGLSIILGAPYIFSEVQLSSMRLGIASLEHVPESTLVASFSAHGLLGGNGNHCDMLAGQLRRSDVRASTIKAHYKDQRYSMITLRALRDERSPDVSFPRALKIKFDAGVWYAEGVSDVVLRKKLDDIPEGHYVVFSAYQRAPYGDLRCH